MHYNLLNECMNCNMSSTNPSVGMCATMYVGSDRYAMVVTEVLGKNKIRVDYMETSHYELAKIKDDTGAEFIPLNLMHIYTNVNKERTNIVPRGKVFTYRKNKRWMPAGEDLWSTCSIHLGEADNYRDPSF